MVSENDTAPTFTGTLANDDLEAFDLDDHVGIDEGPVVLAFFPGAFTPPCQSEMVALQGELERFENEGATVFGVSADSPFAQRAFAEQNGIEFDLVSDMSRNALDSYGLEIDVDDLGLHGVANRAVYIVDDDGAVGYIWEADEPSDEPDYEELVAQVERAARA